MAIHYSYDGEKLLGTAGAIKKALPLLSDNFFVLYGDSYLPCHYYRVQEVYEKSQKQSLMTVFHNEGQWDASNVEFIAGKITAYNKKNRTERMAYIDYGLGIFSRQIFTDIPLQISYDLADLYSNLLKNDQLVGHEVQQRFYEVGSFKGIQELESYLTEKKEFYEFY
jgi:MurNAc alpha-1-phosphate uridylyltransferase